MRDHYLVPPKGVSVPLQFQRHGIRYDDLSEDEKEQWDAIEWDDQGTARTEVEAEAVNKWLFNKDTVDKVLEHVMLQGIKVAGGDRLGKTIVFAKNHNHAEFIAERFNVNYPHYKGEFARVIDFEVKYVDKLIDDFSNPAKSPHIAISVDMLDTGIDIPEVVNLVFFKLVRSKTKFWQMVGRGTRLRPDLFGPGNDKKEFFIFDYCQNLEFFSQDPETTEGAAGESLGKRLFVNRVELIQELDGIAAGAKFDKEEALRAEIAERLRTEVAEMNVNNFIVRPRRALVEKYADPKSWQKLGPSEESELIGQVAGLPSELEDNDLEAKQFDLLMLRLQLALLRRDRSYTRWSRRVREIASALEEKASIPMVQQQIELILDLQTDAFWEDITTPILENVRKRLRALVKLIDKTERKKIYTDFEDIMGDAVNIELPGFGGARDFASFREKTQQFLKRHEDSPVVQKLRWN